MSHVSTGRAAEDKAVEYLTDRGYRIIARNWRTRYCEIDIVAEKSGGVYFVEVKYRETPTQGQGLDYITPKKLRQMHFAAEMWLQERGWSGESSLAVLEITGQTFEVTNFIKDYL